MTPWRDPSEWLQWWEDAASSWRSAARYVPEPGRFTVDVHEYENGRAFADAEYEGDKVTPYVYAADDAVLSLSEMR